MDIKKILEAQNNTYQLIVARAVVNFWRADIDTQAQLLDSYLSIIQEYDDEEYHNRELQQNQGLDVDAYLDDPRHGQGSKGEH